MTLAERFASKYIVAPSGCWIWMAFVDPNGYPRIGVGWHGTVGAHRVSHELYIGPIPEGLQVDHLCRVRRCVNPLHLQAVTPRVNTLRSLTISARNARKTHCQRGHEFSAENTYRQGREGRCSQRLCRRCHQDARRQRKALQKLAREAS